MRFRVTVRKLNETDGQTDGRGALQYLLSQAFGAAGDNKVKRMHGKSLIAMDSASGPSNICNLCASTHKELYNCVS